VDLSKLLPRSEFIDLNSEFTIAGQFNPITLEGCVVKLADKIAYVGRDIEDALNLGFLTQENVAKLKKIVNLKGKEINTSTIISEMIKDICKTSTASCGICLSEEMADKLKKIKKFNYEHVYSSKKFNAFKNYAHLIINQIFQTLLEFYKQEETISFLLQNENNYPTLIKEFINYLCKYVNLEILPTSRKREFNKYKNVKIYESLQTEKFYVKAILDYISGMTDRYIVETFKELITF